MSSPLRIRNEDDIAAFLASREDLLAALRIVATLGLRDSWIAGGFIRNAVWDALSGRRTRCATDDVDVVYYDPRHKAAEIDAAIEASLSREHPAYAWSVKNQARMHVRNGDPPYRSASDAMAQWPETATAIGAQLDDGRLSIAAPHGVGDLVGLIVRPTPRMRGKMEIYRARLDTKNWRARWPEIRIVDA